MLGAGAQARAARPLQGVALTLSTAALACGAVGLSAESGSSSAQQCLVAVCAARVALTLALLLTQVRAASLQDLIYKQGQAGVTKATVTLVFKASPIGASTTWLPPEA